MAFPPDIQILLNNDEDMTKTAPRGRKNGSQGQPAGCGHGQDTIEWSWPSGKYHAQKLMIDSWQDPRWCQASR